MPSKRFIILVMLIIMAGPGARAQDTSLFAFPIEMDEVVISAARSGWDVQGFINRVKNDTTFYKAFKTLRVVSHSINNDIKILNNDLQPIATYQSTTHQSVQNGCRTMSLENEKVTGDFFDGSGDYNYLTGELFAYLFFTKGKVCGETDIVTGPSKREKGQLGRYKAQLKQLIFNPGSAISGLPFIGNKVSIFEPDVAKMYDFKLLSVAYAGEDCYLFKVIPKPVYANDVVYNELSTWFRKSDYSIVARNYALSYRTLLFNFDVNMKVRLEPLGNKWVPKSVSYNGYWRAISKGRERAQFNATFHYP